MNRATTRLIALTLLSAVGMGCDASAVPAAQSIPVLTSSAGSAAPPSASGPTPLSDPSSAGAGTTSTTTPATAVTNAPTPSVTGSAAATPPSTPASSAATAGAGAPPSAAGAGASAGAGAGAGGASAAAGSAEQQLLDLIEQSKKQVVISSDVVMPLYKQLQPVTIDFMISIWHGSVFSGSPEGWWGKNMSNPDDVQPMLFSNSDGSVYANESYGRASLSEQEWNGLSKSVALVYKTLPITDYFRKVNEQTVLGLTPPSFFFQLTRDNTTPVMGAVGPKM